MARSRRSRMVTVQTTLRVPSELARRPLPTFTAPDISYVQHVARQLDVATIRNSVRRSVRVAVPLVRRRDELPGTRSFARVALLGDQKLKSKSPKQKILCKCHSNKSERQKDVSRKFFERFGARRSGGGSAYKRVHACEC